MKKHVKTIKAPKYFLDKMEESFAKMAEAAQVANVDFNQDTLKHEDTLNKFSEEMYKAMGELVADRKAKADVLTDYSASLKNIAWAELRLRNDDLMSEALVLKVDWDEKKILIYYDIGGAIGKALAGVEQMIRKGL